MISARKSTIFQNISTFSRIELPSRNETDFRILIKEYKDRIFGQLAREEEGGDSPFISFQESRIVVPEENWLEDNHERFFQNTENEHLVKQHYLSELGGICSMIYTPDGKFIICGHNTGLIQMRNGKSGVVLATLRNIQFPHKPVFALAYSRTEERVCYAACTDGAVYRIEIPNLDANVPEHKMCISADPALGCLQTQFYGSPGISSHSTPFIVSKRAEPWCLGLTADNTKMIVGYDDCAIKVFDLKTQEVEMIYKVNKMRVMVTPKKMQLFHTHPVCALRCHDEKPTMFATAAWDKSLRIWDTRCQVGCMMTFEGVDCAHDSIDLNREQAICGGWRTTEALSVWDLTARKRQCIVRVQNRRPDVDGEYIYACRYWRSSQFNRKGKYALIGGSGTKCVEVVNLHNRYISCSYPAPGTVLAVASHEERIAFGGTTPIFNIVSFHDPKHEKPPEDIGSDYPDYTKAAATSYEKVEADCSAK